MLRRALEILADKRRAATYAPGSGANGPRPIAIQHTPDSLLSRPPSPAHAPYFVGRRPRLATCGGVAWFHGHHLATVNLLGNAVHTYSFDARGKTFTPTQWLCDLPGLVRPENLTFSPDGALLAVTNSIDGALNIYRVDGKTHTIDPTPAASIRCGDSVNPHGVSFSPSSRTLLFSTVEDPGSLRVFQIVAGTDHRVDANLVQVLANPMRPLKPKGVAIAPDGRFAAIAYGPNATPRPQRDEPGFLAIHRFDPETGCSPKPLWTSGRALGLRCAEDVNFFPDGSHVVITDQASDSATVVAFDGHTGAIGQTTMAIGNPLAQLSFPHGNAVSGDGRFLAVANYGDDKVTVYDVAAFSDQATARS